MKTILQSMLLGASLTAAVTAVGVIDTPLSTGFVRDAAAGLIVAPVRRTVVATTAVATTAAVASSSANANAAAQANAAAAQANAAAAAAKSAAPPPVGTIVTTLPPGCAQDKLNGVDYMRCGSAYYKPSMVGTNLVFVVAQP